MQKEVSLRKVLERELADRTVRFEEGCGQVLRREQDRYIRVGERQRKAFEEQRRENTQLLQKLAAMEEEVRLLEDKLKRATCRICNMEAAYKFKEQKRLLEYSQTVPRPNSDKGTSTPPCRRVVVPSAPDQAALSHQLDAALHLLVLQTEVGSLGGEAVAIKALPALVTLCKVLSVLPPVVQLALLTYTNRVVGQLQCEQPKDDRTAASIHHLGKAVQAVSWAADAEPELAVLQTLVLLRTCTVPERIATALDRLRLLVTATQPSARYTFFTQQGCWQFNRGTTKGNIKRGQTFVPLACQPGLRSSLHGVKFLYLLFGYRCDGYPAASAQGSCRFCPRCGRLGVGSGN